MAEAQPEGRRVASRYHLLEAIGRGGMGIVWRAHDEFLDREVAIKEVRYADMLGEDNQEDFNRRTKREARAAGRLTHPNVVVVHDVVEEDGRPWIVMQLVESRSLGKVMRQDGPLPPKRVAEIGLQLLDALRAAHAQGVLHRDVKPENVLLADDGRVVLTDFGIATLETETALTMTGIAGTPAFIPPERIKGATAQRESDLWSLGATLYAAVEGKPPHDRGGALPTMHAILNDEPEPPVHAGRLAPVLEGLLRKDPALRMNYDEAERLLRAVAEGEGEPKSPSSPPRRPSCPPCEPLSTSATAETDPGIQFQAEGFPATGAKLGAAVPALFQASRSLPRPRAGRAPGARREGGGRGGTAEARLRGGAETRPAGGRPSARPETARRHGRAPFPRPGPSPSRRHARLPETGRTPSLPYGSPSRPRGPNPSPRPGVLRAPSDGAGTEDPSFQRMMTATSRNVSRTPMKRGLLVILPALLVVGVVAGWLGTAQRPGRRRTRAPDRHRRTRADRAGRTGNRVSATERPGRDDPGEHSRAEALTVSFAESHQDEEERGVHASRRLAHAQGQQRLLGGPAQGMVRGEAERETGAVPRPERLGELPDDRVRRQGGLRPEEGLGEAGALQQGQLPRLQADPDREGRLHGEGRRLGVHLELSAGKARVINRGFIAKKGGRGYAIYWHTLASDWKKNLPLFEGSPRPSRRRSERRPDRRRCVSLGGERN